MIPNEAQAKALWDKYRIPDQKRKHLALVAKVATFLGVRIEHFSHRPIHSTLLVAASLLHDIDKNTPPRPGERHPDTAVRILREEGMGEVAELVKAHPLHGILDQNLSPKTLEEKILFLADKMVKYDIVGVDQRFNLWDAEKLPSEAVRILRAAYPKVKELEKEMFSLARVSFEEVAKLA